MAFPGKRSHRQIDQLLVSRTVRGVMRRVRLVLLQLSECSAGLFIFLENLQIFLVNDAALPALKRSSIAE